MVTTDEEKKSTLENVASEVLEHLGIWDKGASNQKFEDCTDQVDYVLVLQNRFRRKKGAVIRLDRKNLVQRIQHEDSTFKGTVRLLNIVTIFVLLLVGIRFSDNVQAKAGVRRTLDNAYSFEELENSSTHEQLWERLIEMEKAYERFFPISSSVFRSELTTVEVMGSFRTFSNPEVMSETSNLPVDINEFTLQTWIRLSPTFVGGGYIIRKRAANLGPGSELSCWAWYLGAKGEQQLHYGAHQFYKTLADVDPILNPSGRVQSKPQVSISQNMDESTGGMMLEFEKLYLLTLVVTPHNVTFYKDMAIVGTYDLPFQITNCNNPRGGLLVGDKDISLGQLRFYPKAFNSIEVQEVYEHGALLRDIASSSSPVVMQLSDTDQLSLKLVETSNYLTSSSDENAWMSSLLNVAQSANIIASADVNDVDEVPPAPFGRMRAASQEPIDHKGYNYTSVIFDPLSFRPGDADMGEDPYYMTREDFPPWGGTGVTIGFWYKHDSINIPWIFAASTNLTARDSMTWGNWMTDRGWGIRNSASLPVTLFAQNEEAISLGVYSLENKLNPGAWRHVTYQFDAQNDVLRIFLDGAFLDEELMEEGVIRKIDELSSGPQGVVAFNNALPGWSWSGKIALGDVRVYVEDERGALPPELIREMALDGSAVQRSCVDASELFDSNEWTDFYGHNCNYFFDNRELQPNICEVQGAREACRLACTKLPCYPGPKKSPHVRYVGNKIRMMQPKGKHGSLCLSSDVDTQAMLDMCRKGKFDDPLMKQLMATERRPNEGAEISQKYVNLTDCEELANSIDETCTYDAQIIKDFTKDVQANNGDFTIVWWVKKVDSESLQPNGKFMPSLTLFASMEPPTPVYAQNGDPSFYRAYLYSHCAENNQDNLRISVFSDPDLSESDWTMLSVIRKNATSPPDSSIVCSVDSVFHEQPGISVDFPLCLRDELSTLMSAFEVNRKILMAPITLLPWALSKQEIQRYYYASRPGMDARSGPPASDAQLAQQTYPVNKLSYIPSFSSIAPPVMFVQRAEQGSGGCEYSFSSDWVSTLHQKSVAQRCKHPNVCSLFAVNDPTSLIKCEKKGLQEEGSYFGLNVTKFSGNSGFADFLYSYTRHPFLARDNAINPTTNFIDAYATAVEVFYVFYSPGSKTSSIMQITAKFDADREVSVEVNLTHLQILGSIASFTALQIVNLVSVLLLVIDTAFNFKKIRKWYILVTNRKLYHLSSAEEKKDARQVYNHLVILGIDVALASMVTTIIVIRLLFKYQVPEHTTETTGVISDIPWDEPYLSPASKKQTYLETVEQLIVYMDQERYTNFLTTISMVIVLVRVLIATGCHPRLAILTGALRYGLDDLWHLMLLVLMTQLFFSGIGVWMFGEYREDFADLNQALQTILEMMFGDFPDNWQKDGRALQLFSITYMLVVYLIVVNFVLAIIVDSYFKVRDDNVENEVELEFFTDTYYCCMSQLEYRRKKWPSMQKIALLLDGCIKKNIGLDELRGLGVFKSVKDAYAFLLYYAKFDAMASKELVNPDYMDLADEIEKRTALLIGTAPSTKNARRKYGVTVSAKETEYGEGMLSSLQRKVTEQQKDIQIMASNMQALLASVKRMEQKWGIEAGPESTPLDDTTLDESEPGWGWPMAKPDHPLKF